MGPCDSGFRSLSKKFTTSRAPITLQSPCKAVEVGFEPTTRVNETGFQDRSGQPLRFTLPIPGLFRECPGKILLFVVVNGIEPLSLGPKPNVLAFILNDQVSSVF